VKSLLKTTATIEAVTGVALVVAPSSLVSVLMNASLEGSGALIVARITGFALLSLAIACWQSRNNSSASAIVQAMLFYNITIAALLVYCIFVEKFSALGLGPVLILHIGLAVWCVRSLYTRI
jgi:hypothetical protein